MSSPNRRDFVLASAATCAALGARTFAGAADRPNEKVVLAVMGVHGRGQGLLQGFSGFPDVEIAYVCDPDSNVIPKALEELRKRQVREPKVEKDFRRALDGEAPGPIDFSLWLAGPTGTGKSALAALAQQHFGAGLDARHLPGSWSSTANALEGMAFAAKDALLVVDDYAPGGAAGDRQRLERDADRLLRAQGNRAGRQRMRADGGLRPAKPPRGLIFSTGEDVPPGQSLRGRMLVLEVSSGDVPLARLTPHQHAAAAGRCAEALAGYVRWLAPQYGELCDRLPGERAGLRDKALTDAASARTPGIVADLALGLNLFLDFARSVGALTTAARDALAGRGWEALQAAGTAQAEQVKVAEPTGMFMSLLAGAIGTTAYVAGPDGREPRDKPEAWGWNQRTYGVGEQERTDWYPCQQGKRIGWVDGADLFLEPEASYAAAQDLANRKGDGLPVTAQTLRRRLKDRGLLVSCEQDRTTNRRTLEGRERSVLHLRAAALCTQKPGEPGEPGGETPETGESPPVSSPGFNGRSAKPGDETGGNPRRNGHPPPVPPVPPVSGRGGAGHGHEMAPSPPPGARLHCEDAHGRVCEPHNAARWTWEGATAWHDATRHPPPAPGSARDRTGRAE